jgi:hypothetical protein
LDFIDVNAKEKLNQNFFGPQERDFAKELKLPSHDLPSPNWAKVGFLLHIDSSFFLAM